MNSRNLLKASSISILEVLQKCEYGEHNKDSELNQLGRVLPKLIKESVKHNADVNWHSICQLCVNIAEELIVIMKERELGPRATSEFLNWLSDYESSLSLLVNEENKKQAIESLIEADELEDLFNV